MQIGSTTPHASHSLPSNHLPEDTAGWVDNFANELDRPPEMPSNHLPEGTAGWADKFANELDQPAQTSKEFLDTFGHLMSPAQRANYLLSQQSPE